MSPFETKVCASCFLIAWTLVSTGFMATVTWIWNPHPAIILTLLRSYAAGLFKTNGVEVVRILLTNDIVITTVILVVPNVFLYLLGTIYTILPIGVEIQCMLGVVSAGPYIFCMDFQDNIAITLKQECA